MPTRSRSAPRAKCSYHYSASRSRRATALTLEYQISSHSTGVTFVYRGQLNVERSRIEFLLAATCAAFAHVDAVMLSPGTGATVEEFLEFTGRFPNVRSSTFLAAPTRSVRHVRRRLRVLVGARRVVAVGFSAAAFIPRRGCLCWCVNGIPEERLLHDDSAVQRLAVRAAWWASRRAKALRTVVVSEPMAGLVHQRLGGAMLVVPNAVRLDVFRQGPEQRRQFLTYLGGGSPWQGLDRLARVWGAMYRLDPSLRFRVITQDPRAGVLASELPAEAVEVCSGEGPAETAQMLAEARLGFLFRSNDLVNRVSWPMKLGEYLAAGVPVVLTACGWGAADLVAKHQAGLIVDWNDDSGLTAHQVVDYLRATRDRQPTGVGAAADELDSGRWLDLLVTALKAADEEASGVPHVA